MVTCIKNAVVSLNSGADNAIYWSENTKTSIKTHLTILKSLFDQAEKEIIQLEKEIEDK